MRGRAAALAWSLGALALALFVAGNVLNLVASPTRGPTLTAADRLLFATFLVYAVVGSLVASRRPENPIGWLLLAEALLFQLVCFSIGYVGFAVYARPGTLPGGSFVAWMGNSAWIPILMIAAFVFLLFPTGRLRSPRWRPVVWVGLVLGAAAFVAEAFRPGPLSESLAEVDNPFGIPAAEDALSAMGTVAGAIVGPFVLSAALLSFVLRLRAADGVERRQLRWLGYAALLLAVAFLIGQVLETLGVSSTVYSFFYLVPLAVVPVAIGVAILRYHLYEIDVVIDRTVVVAAVVAFVAVVYLGVIVGVGAAVGNGTGSNVVLVAVATALVAMGFQPVLERARRLGRTIAYGAPSPHEQEVGVAVRSLGAFQLFRDGIPVHATAWQSKKARTLLKILIARRGRSTPRAILMEALWPEEDPAKLANRLSVALATVRGVLDPDKTSAADYFVVADKDAIRLDLERVAVDVEDFLERAGHGIAACREGREREGMTALAEAESLYAGDFLEEDQYDDWAADLREEARATYITVARLLAEAASRARDQDAAVRYYLRILDKDSWDEPAHLSLVATLERAGRHGEARRRYRTYTSRMGELDLPAAPFPSPART